MLALFALKHKSKSISGIGSQGRNIPYTLNSPVVERSIRNYYAVTLCSPFDNIEKEHIEIITKFLRFTLRCLCKLLQERYQHKRYASTYDDLLYYDLIVEMEKHYMDMFNSEFLLESVARKAAVRCSFHWYNNIS